MKRVTLGKSRVRESRPPGSVRAKAKWLSYSTTIKHQVRSQFENRSSPLAGSGKTIDSYCVGSVRRDHRLHSSCRQLSYRGAYEAHHALHSAWSATSRSNLQMRDLLLRINPPFCSYAAPILIRYFESAFCLASGHRLQAIEHADTNERNSGASARPTVEPHDAQNPATSGSCLT